jgi:hypothetical protein
MKAVLVSRRAGVAKHMSFVLQEEDGRLIPFKESCTRVEAEEIAKSCINSQLILLNKEGKGLGVEDCFDSVLRDLERRIHLRLGNIALFGYQPILSGTQVLFRDDAGLYYTWDDIQL